ncbi:hypothetical protein BC833DRAFT_625404 [Globomyces pollinis-pini]|nr:hypothetical protein BC833DRAFT_625404 [Globomyces pollinis-pini]
MNSALREAVIRRIKSHPKYTDAVLATQEKCWPPYLNSEDDEAGESDDEDEYRQDKGQGEERFEDDGEDVELNGYEHEDVTAGGVGELKNDEQEVLNDGAEAVVVKEVIRDEEPNEEAVDADGEAVQEDGPVHVQVEETNVVKGVVQCEGPVVVQGEELEEADAVKGVIQCEGAVLVQAEEAILRQGEYQKLSNDVGLGVKRKELQSMDEPESKRVRL